MDKLERVFASTEVTRFLAAHRNTQFPREELTSHFMDWLEGQDYNVEEQALVLDVWLRTV